MSQQAMIVLNTWLQALTEAPCPVLASSIAEIEELQIIEEQTGQVDAYTLAQGLGYDPLMMLNVLAHVSKQCQKREAEPPETFVSALIMLGIGPFFRDFNALISTQAQLREHPQAHEGLMAVLHRAQRAARFATSFAIHRQDEDAAVIQEAAMLHDVGEMLLWCRAPGQMLLLSDSKQTYPKMHGIELEMAQLGVSTNALTQAIMEKWQLSPLLRRCVNDPHAEHPQVLNVKLAMQWVRHTEDGVTSAKAMGTIDEDIQAIAQLLTLSPAATHQMLKDLDT